MTLLLQLWPMLMGICIGTWGRRLPEQGYWPAGR